ncbi:uncharacterized protein [Clytia hemisphaerica]|uniref:C2H2-type domain-containing protein n=1 Tax=Clytia hemisphaerica TaxID=252671 RepID=A0A7M5WR34_9CNID
MDDKIKEENEIPTSEGKNDDIDDHEVDIEDVTSKEHAIENDHSMYSCSIHENNITVIHSENNETTTISSKDSVDQEKPASPTQVVVSDEPPPPYFTSYGNADIQSQLATKTGYEVTTYVTEDGQTGHLIIGNASNYPTDVSSSGIVTLGDTNITTAIASPDGSVLSLGEEAMEQLAGLENFPPGAIQIATTQNPDGTTQLQYILNEDPNIQDIESNIVVNTKFYKCDFEKCDKQFQSPYRLRLHSRTHAGALAAETIVCVEEGCGKRFATDADLQKHSKLHVGQKDFICEVAGCKKEYTTAHHLKVHKRQHSGEKPFICDWVDCGKMFTTGYGLKSHYRTHTNERPYKCFYDDCKKAFKTSGDLQKHIRTHTGERPFVCTYPGCNRSFTTSNIRKVHLRTHTGEKPYRCEVEGCGRTFASATNHKNHARIHTGERPYLCEVPGCMKRFTEYSSLYKHNIVHTHQKPYTCHLCLKTYRQTSTLAMHKRTVHGDELTEAELQGVNTIETTTYRPPKKIRRISQHDARETSIPPPSPAPSTSSTAATGYIQGMSLIINNTDSSDFSGRISAQNVTESTEIPGAIAIPIQVTMNPDGTIAGAPGLNLTDGNGRIIPVNLSVSIPVLSSSQVENNTEHRHNTSEQVKEETDRNTGHTPINSMYHNSPSASSEIHEEIITVIPDDSAQITPRQSNDISDEDMDDRDVTDKYLTSHYNRKDFKTTSSG